MRAPPVLAQFKIVARRVDSLQSDPNITQVEYVLGYIGFWLLNEASDELEAVSFDDRFTVPVARARVELHMAAKHWDIVIGYASKLVESNSELHEPWIAWAYALRKLEKVAEALEVLDRGVLKHGDTHPVFHYNLACYHSLLSDFKPAEICLNLACEKDTSLKPEAKTDPDLGLLWAHLAKDG